MAKKNPPPNPADTSAPTNPAAKPRAPRTRTSPDDSKARADAALSIVSQAGKPLGVTEVTAALAQRGFTSELEGRGVNGQTSRALRTLVQDGLLDKRGKARGTVYFVRGASAPTDESDGE